MSGCRKNSENSTYDSDIYSLPPESIACMLQSVPKIFQSIVNCLVVAWSFLKCPEDHQRFTVEKHTKNAIYSKINNKMLNAASILGILPPDNWHLLEEVTKIKVTYLLTYLPRFSKTSSFVSGNQIDYPPKPKAEANNWCAYHWQMRQLSDNSGKRYTIFTHSVGTTTHEKNIICWKTNYARGSYLQVTWWALGQRKGEKRIKW